MKKLLILSALFLCACNSNSVDSPGGNQTNGTLLIDRTGITDSVYLDSTSEAIISFMYQAISFQFDTIRLSYSYAGTSLSHEYLLAIRNPAIGSYFYKFGQNFTPNTSFSSTDTSFALAPYNGNIQGYISAFGNPANNVWFAIKSLRVFGH